MANEEHLRILRQGLDAWHKWRKENPDVRPSLRDAYLSGADLHKADFSEAAAAVAATAGATGQTVRQRHIGDFKSWKDHVLYKRAFDRLLRDLKADNQP